MVWNKSTTYRGRFPYSKKFRSRINFVYWFLYCAGELFVWFAILSSVINAQLSLTYNTQVSIVMPTVSTLVTVFLYILQWYFLTIVDWVYEVPCLGSGDTSVRRRLGRNVKNEKDSFDNLARDFVTDIFVAQALPQYLFVIFFCCWFLFRWYSARTQWKRRKRSVYTQPASGSQISNPSLSSTQIAVKSRRSHIKRR